MALSRRMRGTELIDQMTDQFYNLFMRANAPLKIPFHDDLAPDLLIPPADASGWIGWKPRRMDGALDWTALEAEIGACYPPSFKRWYGRTFALDLDCGVVRLIAPRPPDPLACLRAAATTFGTTLVAQGLLPFGREGNDAGPLCFDTRVAGADGETPVVSVDRELIDIPEDAISGVLFSSFERLLACLNHLLKAETPADRARRIRAFARIDPQGARVAWPYWRDVADRFLPDERLAGIDDEDRDADVDAAYVRSVRTDQPSNFADQYRNLVLAESVVASDPALALETLATLDEPGLVVRVRIARTRCLIRIGRAMEAAPIVEHVARDWLGPERPNSANQHLTRAEMLELLELLELPGFNELRAAVMDRPDPEIVVGDGDGL
ncbi:MAG: hypothetical protein AB7P03_05065 [Kofleriaceae bacterium]